MNRLVALAVALLVALTWLAPSASQAAPVKKKDYSLTGTWVFQVTITPPGAPAPQTFESTIVYTDDRQVIETTSRVGDVSAGLGVWKKTGRSTYRAMFSKYRFDATGKYLGRTVVRETIKVTGRNTLTNSSTTDIYGPTGALVTHLDNPPATATRMRL